MRIKGTLTTIKDSVFESKTRAEQIEYVSNLQEFKFLPKNQKDAKIKEVLDIKRKESFVGSVNSSISGSWDDYYNSSSIDPTGSYLAPFITTIGLYDDDNNMVASAKLPKPIKSLPDYPVNFIVRFDT